LRLLRLARPAPPDAAGPAARRLFQQHASDLTALAGREFGLYPPGTVVRLASLELALVVRGAAETRRSRSRCRTNGEPRATPAQRDTGQPGFAVVAAVTPALLRARIPWAQLFTQF
jgi:hypothetical protein